MFKILFKTLQAIAMIFMVSLAVVYIHTPAVLGVTAISAVALWNAVRIVSFVWFLVDILLAVTLLRSVRKNRKSVS